jgi:hypothetical protein
MAAKQSKKPDIYDVAIVGAGPSGASNFIQMIKIYVILYRKSMVLTGTQLIGSGGSLTLFSLGTGRKFSKNPFFSACLCSNHSKFWLSMLHFC